MSEEQKVVPHLKEGPAIWVESCLTEQEYKEQKKKYPKTCHKRKLKEFFKSDYEWRWQMGTVLNLEQIQKINNNLDYIKRQVKINETQTILH